MKKKLMALFTACLMMLAIILPVSLGGNDSQETAKAESTGKPIDIFLLAGQSNAAGESYLTGVTNQTFNNVWYAGEAGPRPYSNGAELSNDSMQITSVNPGNGYDVTYPFNPVKLGLGSGTSNVGPEFGMAKYLNEVYDEDHPAMILKTATGAVGLYRAHTRGNYDFRGKNANTRQGFLYRRLLENLDATMKSLKENGYEPTIKAFVWMQGENEMTGGKSVYGSYPQEFALFASNMRKDIGALIGKTETQMVQDLPFIVGEVSPTGGYGRDGFSQTRNEDFIEVQRTIPNYTDNVKLVKSSMFDTDYESGNPWHWSGPDMVTIGTMFAAAAMNDKIFDSITYGNLSGCSVSAKLNDDETQIIFSVKPNMGFKLQTFKVNNVDVTAQVANGQYVADYTDGDTFFVEASTSALERRKVTISYVRAGANVQFSDNVTISTTNVRQIYDEETLELRIIEKNGYTIKSVTINDQPMTCIDEENNIYSYGPISSDVAIKITFNAPGEEGGNTGGGNTGGDNTGGNTGGGSSKKGGCGGESITLALSTVATLLAAAFVLKK